MGVQFQTSIPVYEKGMKAWPEGLAEYQSQPYLARTEAFLQLVEAPYLIVANELNELPKRWFEEIIQVHT